MNCTTDDTCPHCGKAIDDLWEFFSDQADPKLDCPHCSKPIQGQEVITYQLCQVEDNDGFA
jgi:DNA-directed RNA polymerase subunit RPC12/RpoP